MAIQIFQPKLDNNRRIIVISDILGNYDAFTRLLEKAKYTREDYLILLGNLVERGPESLRTLRYIMELSASRRVFAVTGDMDLLSREVFRADRNHELLQYVLRNHSLVRDMCAELGIRLAPDVNMHSIKLELREVYAAELEFLMNLPHVIETPNFVFAHAQILPGDIAEMEPRDVYRADAFLSKGFSFDRYVVVGHWPTLRYKEYKRCANPIIQRARKIICVDGGMTVLRDGQMNALIIPNCDSEDFSFVSVDDFPKKKALNSQNAGLERHLIQEPDNRVKILQTSGDMCYCRQEKTEKNYWIPKAFLKKGADGFLYTEDYTDYQLRVTFEDEVSVVLETSRGTLIKRDGVTGWYYGMLE